MAIVWRSDCWETSLSGVEPGGGVGVLRGSGIAIGYSDRIQTRHSLHCLRVLIETHTIITSGSVNIQLIIFC